MRITEYAALADRLFLAAVFLVAGATKLVDRPGSTRALRDFGLPARLAEPLGGLLPILEIAVAFALPPAALTWYGACGGMALLALFLAATGVNLASGRKPDCHCFGQLYSAPVGWPTLVRGGVLAACASWLVVRGRMQTGPEIWIWLTGLDAHGRKAVIVIACVACLLFFVLLDRARPHNGVIEPHPPTGRSHGLRPPVHPREEPLTERPVGEPPPGKVSPRGIGLAKGTSAPEFELTGITGRKYSLRSLLAPGRTLMLLFSSPYCESCLALLPSLARWMREQKAWLDVVMISRGTAEENLAKVKSFGIEEVLLQQNFEVAESYDCTSTPAAVLVDADGIIASGLAVSAIAITQLIEAEPAGSNRQEDSRSADS